MVLWVLPSCRLCNSLSHWPGLTWVTRYCRHDRAWLLRLGHKKTLWIPWNACSGEATHYPVRTLKQPYEEFPEKRDWAFHQQPVNNWSRPPPQYQQRAECTILEADLPAQVRPLANILTMIHERPWDRTIQLFPYPWPSKTVCDNKCLLF